VPVVIAVCVDRSLQRGELNAFPGPGPRAARNQCSGTLRHRLFELLRLGLVDEVSAYIAPMIFGGESAPTMAAGPGVERSAAIPLKLIDVEKSDDGGVLLKYLLERSI